MNVEEETDNIRLSEPRKLKINKVEDYVFRIPSSKKFECFSPNLLNSRMRRIKIWIGNPYISATSIHMSGMLNMALEIYKEKGEITREDYLNICTRYNYGLDGSSESRYWFNIKALFEQYKEIHDIK